MAEYRAAQNGTMPPPEERWPPFTYDADHRLYQSPSDRQQAFHPENLSQLIERFRAKNGGRTCAESPRPRSSAS
jgi:hypothetical protein